MESNETVNGFSTLKIGVHHLDTVRGQSATVGQLADGWGAGLQFRHSAVGCCGPALVGRPPTSPNRGLIGPCKHPSFDVRCNPPQPRQTLQGNPEDPKA